MPETHLSQDAYDRLHAELTDLSTRGRVEIAQTIQRAREMGDLSENGDYHAAKDDQGKMEARIRQIESILKSAVVVGGGSNGDEVTAGSVVTVRYEGDSDTEQYLVGSIEERPEDLPVVSPGSPMGSALLGRRAGEVVEYAAPSGTLRVEIVEVGS